MCCTESVSVLKSNATVKEYQILLFSNHLILSCKKGVLTESLRRMTSWRPTIGYRETNTANYMKQ